MATGRDGYARSRLRLSLVGLPQLKMCMIGVVRSDGVCRSNAKPSVKGENGWVLLAIIDATRLARMCPCTGSWAREKWAVRQDATIEKDAG